jgi:penicillin-binding protein 2
MSNKKNNPWFLDVEGLPSMNKASKSTTWVEDSFVFDSQYGRQVATPHTKQHVGISFSQKRGEIMIILLGILFLMLGGRIAYMQLIKGRSFLISAEQNRQRVIPIPAERGMILDRNGVQLTDNIPNFSLALVPQDLPRDTLERELVVRRLSELTGKETIEIRDTLKKYGNYSFESIVILEGLDYETALSIQIDSADLPGIHIQRGSKRLYLPDGTDQRPTSSMSHILGYEGKLSPEELEELYANGYLPSDSVGKIGVEKTYETALRGVYGRRRIEVDARGREQNIIAEESPTSGSHLRLSIDTKMQHALEDAIKGWLKNDPATKASGIVMNPNNGEVLALVSLPTFENNDFSGGISVESYRLYLEDKDNPLFNRSISGTYPSGSTVKPAVAAAALQEGIITSRTSFLSVGGLQVSQWFFPDWQAGGHGITNVRKSLADSVNTFYYYIGGGYKEFEGLGVKKITEYLRKFGLASKLGIDLPGEKSGFLPSKDWKEKVKGERWYVGDTYNLSIGQGDLLVTPLQVAELTSVVANNGTVYKPRIVKGILNTETDQEIATDEQILQEGIIDPAHLRTIRQGMRDCVTSGSCRRLASLPFSAAGKTGTAQWHSEKAHHAWFTSFAPYDKPEIVVTILVEEGEGGSKIAAPIANDFYRWWWYYKNS